MDSKATIEDEKKIVQKFCEDRDWDQFHNPKDLAIMLSTEAAELLEIFRYKDEKQVEEIMNGPKRRQVEDEVADLFFGVLRFAQKNDIDISTALDTKMVENVKKYPVELVKGKNKKYNEY